MVSAVPNIVPRHVAITMDGNGRWAAARGLARYRHRVRVAAECGDVVAYPPQGRELVGKAEVAPGDPRRAQVAEHAEPVVDRDDDYVAVPGEPVAAVPLP